MKTTNAPNATLARTSPYVAANDNAHGGLLGVRVVFVIGPCAEETGSITRVERNRWGVSAEVDLGDGRTEWVHVQDIRPRGSLGIGCNLI